MIDFLALKIFLILYNFATGVFPQDRSFNVVIDLEVMTVSLDGM